MIRHLSKEDFKSVLSIAQQEYEKECNYVPELKNADETAAITKFFSDTPNHRLGYAYIENGQLLGYLFFSYIEERSNLRIAYSPVYGYGCIAPEHKREFILSHLFQTISKELYDDKPTQYQCKVYAHDDTILHFYWMTEFGTQCTDTIRCTSAPIAIPDSIPFAPSLAFFEASKDYIKSHMDPILALYQKLVDHLRQSPVFYPGTEFTTNVYREYLLDPQTRFFVVSDQEQPIAILSSSLDSNSFLTDDPLIRNIGDIYVEPAYRGQYIAQKLLSFANDTLQKEGILLLWVEHGTANPTARGFWDKYFKNYTYTMIRTIIPIQ